MAIKEALCNHCDESHWTLIALPSDEMNASEGVVRSMKKASRNEIGEVRKKSGRAETNVSGYPEDDLEQMDVRMAFEKCIICRTDCGYDSECLGRGMVESVEATESEEEEQRSREEQDEEEENYSFNGDHEYQQRPICGDGPPERCRRSMLTSSLDWGGGAESSAAAANTRNFAQERSRSMRKESRKGRSHGSMFLLVLAVLLTTTCSMWDTGRLLGPGSLLANANELRPDPNATSLVDNGICQSIDVRNSPIGLEQLRNCRVIEGFLQILLIDLIDAPGATFDNYTFPLLTEITDFLLVYRVRKLRSIGKLFPNLSVIRGNSLFNNYALIVFEVFQLEEVGLHSLKYIGRGGVRMEKNMGLCFSETVDWSQISNGTFEASYFTKNKKENECPVCPGGNSSQTRSCPVLAYPKKKYSCWNMEHCQVVCPIQCPWNCDNLGNCCDKSCLGGCSIGNPRNCTACRHYSLGYSHDRKCIDECPSQYYKHMNRRCVTAAECLGTRKPIAIQAGAELPALPYFPFAGECRLTCPVGYQLDSVNRTCRQCPNDLCKKVCNGAKIDSISAAQKMDDCIIIKGTLEIQIRREGGLSVVNELEKFLSKIEEIEGHLKVARSDPLVSLNFFKNLKVIRGIGVDGQALPVSFTLMENENLQDLFNENQTVKILNGQLNFHTNPKLCVNKIANLKDMLAKHIKFDLDSFRSSNGDRVACNLEPLNVTMYIITSKFATISWKPLNISDDERSLLGYVVHYKPAKFTNVTLFDGRDACGFDGWQNDDVPVTSEPFFVFTHLEPNTQYAYYVKTVQLATSQVGGQSNISYFTTLPDQPEIVRNLRVKLSESNEVTLSWDPPRKAHGNLTTYIIKCNLTEENEAALSKRNYCIEKWDASLNNPNLVATPPPPVLPEKTLPMDGKCDCQKEQKLQKPAEAENQIEFEDALHNYVYVKKAPSTRRRRSALDPLDTNNATDPQFFPSTTASATPIFSPRHSIKNGSHFSYIYKEVAVPTTTLTIRELKHFAIYTISVIACRSGPVALNCSNEVILTHRTEPLHKADEIRNLKILGNPKNNSHNVLSLTWDPPKTPNGMVLSYTIKYTNKDIENGIGQLTCIQASSFEINNRVYDLKLGADDGNYSVEVQVTSLGGPGDYSRPVFYPIKNTNYPLWIGLGVGVALMVGLICVMIYFIIQSKKGKKDHRLIAEVNPDYDATPYIPDEYEIPRERVKRDRELGQGSFGMVYAGTVQLKEDDPTEMNCAIKTVNDSATERERLDFLKEAHVMKEFHTPHVVQLLAVVSKGNPPLAVMELMALGDLKGYLRAHRPDADTGRDGEVPVPPSVRQILQMAIEIADGMAYLSYKKFVHRDLAARNCMVAADLTVKIGDFGMTRDIYETDYYRKGDKGLLPVRWMSPESLKDGVFTTSNDVFSYGVVLWEMATLASQPYQGLSNDQVLRYVIDGGVMERPENCPDKLYQLMRRCWEHRPSSRPTFLDIVALLLDDVNDEFYRSSFYFAEEGEAHRYILQNDRHHHPDEGTTLLRPENEMSHENPRENWDMPNNNNNNRRLLEEGGAMPIIKPAQSPLRFLTGKSGNDYKESKF